MEQRTTATAALSQCREIIGAPTKRERFWSDLDERDRKYLLKAAGLPITKHSNGLLIEQGIEELSWPELTGQQQGSIIKAAKRAARWAVGLGVLQ